MIIQLNPDNLQASFNHTYFFCPEQLFEWLILHFFLQKKIRMLSAYFILYFPNRFPKPSFVFVCSSLSETQVPLKTGHSLFQDTRM